MWFSLLLYSVILGVGWLASEAVRRTTWKGWRFVAPLVALGSAYAMSFSSDLFADEALHRYPDAPVSFVWAALTWLLLGEAGITIVGAMTKQFATLLLPYLLIGLLVVMGTVMNLASWPTLGIYALLTVAACLQFNVLRGESGPIQTQPKL